MEQKKSPKVDMGNYKLLFVEIGLVLSLGVTLYAFNYETDFEQKEEDNKKKEEYTVEREIPDTTPPPPPPQQNPMEEIKALVFDDNIEIMEDDVKVDDFFVPDDEGELDTTLFDFGEEEVVEEVVEEEVLPFAAVEEKPTFMGGDANDFSKWVNQRLVYPEIAKENGVQGRVILEFTVEKDGSVTNVKVLRGVDSALDKEAVRVVSSSPKWKPGKQRDRTVIVKYTFPVQFVLR